MVNRLGGKMASYSEWNKAITEYFVSGLPAGETVYLSVDGDALDDIGHRAFVETSEAGWVEDFEAAVKAECVRNGQIDLYNIRGIGSGGRPVGVAFLSAMVLAAHRMAEEDDEEERVSDTNYFTRLQEVFGFTGNGRPPGLRDPGVEEPFWETWNRWIIERGWLPSAEKGRDPVNRYINYPISQALLREGDKGRLERVFKEAERTGRLNRTWDRDRLGTWLRVNEYRFTSKHLRVLIQEPDPRRYEAIMEAIHEVYASMDWEQVTDHARHVSGGALQRRLTSGLYRVEDVIGGAITYHLYPRQPRYKQGETTLQLLKAGDAYLLAEERPGWFFPQPWAEELTSGTLYELQGDTRIKQLALPERGFWILVRDPESPESGIFANWRVPEIGQTFLLLCRKDYADQLQILKDENLINWDQEIPLTGLYDGWVEYRECMVVSPYWSGVLPQKPDLYDALKPELSATITFTGGLKVSDRGGGGWLEGLQPEVKVTSFGDWPIRLHITHPDESYFELEAETNKTVRDLPQLKPGVYLLQVAEFRAAKHIPPKSLRIVGWDSLECSQPRQPFSFDGGKFSLQGTLIKIKEEVHHEEEP